MTAATAAAAIAAAVWNGERSMGVLRGGPTGSDSVLQRSVAFQGRILFLNTRKGEMGCETDGEGRLTQF